MPVFPPRRSPSPIFSDYMVEDEVSSQPPHQPQYPPHQYNAESQDNQLVTVRGRTFLNINSKRPLSESLSRRSSRDSGISSAGSDGDDLAGHTHPQQTHVRVQGGSTRASPVLVIQPRERVSSGSGSGSQSRVGVGAGIGMRIRSALNERPRLRLITPSILGTTTNSPSQTNQVRLDTTDTHAVNLKKSESHRGTSPTRSYQSHTHSSKSATSMRSNSNGVINTLDAIVQPKTVSFSSPCRPMSQPKAQSEAILEDMEAGISASPPTTTSTSSLDAPQLVPTRQSRFWFADGSIILHVENATYKVHRSILESYSTVLRERFSKACHDGIRRGQGEGQVPSVKLEDVSNNDFMQFLALLYPRDFQDRESLTPTQWSSLLTISRTLQIPSLRNLAISFISSSASDVDKIAFGHMHGVKEWLLPSYHALANRSEPLTVEEGWRLGVDVVVRIAKAREMRLTLGERWSEVGGEVLRRIFGDLDLPLEDACLDTDL